MEENNTSKSELKFLITIYALSLAGFGLTRLLGNPIARLFDWAAYGQMRRFFCVLFNGILWIVELGILRVSFRFKKGKRVFHLEDEQKELLTGTRIAGISAVCVLFIFAVSLQTGFRVKLVYDIGDKVTGYVLFERLIKIPLHVIKMVWVMFIIRTVENLFPQKKGFSVYPFLLLAVAPVAAMDIFLYGINLPVTYAVLYMLMPLIYLLVERNYLKATLLYIMLYLL